LAAPSSQCVQVGVGDDERTGRLDNRIAIRIHVAWHGHNGAANRRGDAVALPIRVTGVRSIHTGRGPDLLRHDNAQGDDLGRHDVAAALVSYGLFRQAFAELLDPRFYSIGWIDQGIAGGKITVFGNEHACILVEIKTYPAGAKEVHGLCAAGDLAMILKLIGDAEEWGRAQECIVASVASREAWVRILAEYGYAPYQILVRKELVDGA